MIKNDFVSVQLPTILSYVSPTPGRFPVLCSSVYVDNEALTGSMTQEEKIEYLRRILEEARECGMDMGGIDVSFRSESDTNKIALSTLYGPASKNTGISFFVNNGAMTGNRYDTYLKYTLGLPFVRGISAWDEPLFKDLCSGKNENENRYIPGPLAETYNNLKDMMKTICETNKYPNRALILNLTPSTAPTHIGMKKEYLGLVSSEDKEEREKAAPYMTYLRLVNSLIHPQEWSFDQYQYFIGNYFSQPSSNTAKAKFEFLNGDFYKLLGCYWQISKETKRPFKSFILTTEFSNSTNYTPQPTLNRLRYSTFTSLAYGAQEIQFWTYFQRNHNTGESYSLSPVNLLGQKNELWYSVRKISDEIRRYSRVFLGSKVFYFQHIVGSKTEFPQGNDDNNLNAYGAQNPIESAPLPISVTVTETIAYATGKENLKGVLVSYLYNNPDDTYTNPRPSGTSVNNAHASLYIVIVSHDPDNFKKVYIHFNASALPIVELTPVNPVDARVTGSSSIIRTLEPGGYLIFKYSGPFPTSIR